MVVVEGWLHKDLGRMMTPGLINGEQVEISLQTASLDSSGVAKIQTNNIRVHVLKLLAYAYNTIQSIYISVS